MTPEDYVGSLPHPKFGLGLAVELALNFAAQRCYALTASKGGVGRGQLGRTLRDVAERIEYRDPTEEELADLVKTILAYSRGNRLAVGRALSHVLETET